MIRNFIACLFFSMAVLFASQVNGQGFSGSITYNPPGGQDGCIYSLDVNVDISRPTGHTGIAIKTTASVTAVKGIVFQGKTYSSSQVPGVFQEYLGSVRSDYINLKYTLVAGSVSKGYNTSSGGSIDWNRLLGKPFTFKSDVQAAIQKEGNDLFDNNGISIRNVTIDGTIPFEAYAIAKYLEDQPVKKQASSSSSVSGSSADNTTVSIGSTGQTKAAPQSYYSSQQKTSSGGTSINAVASSTPGKSTWQERNAKMQEENRQLIAQQQQRTANIQRQSKEVSEKFVSDATELVGMIGNIIKSDREAKERKEERRLAYERRQAEEKQQQKEEKEAEEAELRRIAANQLARIELRKAFFPEFPEGGVPFSSTKIDVDQIYYFTYLFDKSTIESLRPVITLSNLFIISRYPDGTWPFKDAILTDIKKLNVSGDITLIGYFTTKQLADEMRSKFVSMAVQSGMDIKNIFYKGRQATVPTTGAADVWSGTDENKKSGNATGDDFWSTDTKPPVAGKAAMAIPRTNGTITRRETTKELEDYWNTDNKAAAATKSAPTKSEEDDMWTVKPVKKEVVADSVNIKNKPKPLLKKKAPVKKSA